MHTNLKRLILAIFSIFIMFLFLGCTPKITIKALEPSKIYSQKVNVVAISNIRNDNLNQTQSIANNVSNKIIDNKRVFTLQNNPVGVDAVIEGGDYKL